MLKTNVFNIDSPLTVWSQIEKKEQGHCPKTEQPYHFSRRYVCVDGCTFCVGVPGGLSAAFYMCVWVSECVCLSVCVKCDLGRFLKACWAVKRRCNYNSSTPLFPPQLHRYLVPATSISPGALTHNSSFQGYRQQHLGSIYFHLDQIKVGTATAIRKHTGKMSEIY